MSKRESNGFADAAGGSRPKRPRRSNEGADGGEAVMSDHAGSEPDMGDTGPAAEAVAKAMDPEEVKSLGLKLWQTVKDAVNKEGRPLSPIFMRRPSKRLYPDYYNLIKQPIALDDIKVKLDQGGYPSMEAVRQDFELCFSNAKEYNMKESDIWKDAKELLKLTNKTYGKMVPREDGEDKKAKAPNLNRLLKTRLQKLADKADDSGRLLSGEFMELPSRKLWPNYYKEIKKPQCLETIFKRIKRKEYSGAEEFAADVELVFSNAMTFNQDHTPIWEDALTLRNLFRQLMSDLPPPFSLPQYSQPSAKIKIKPQAALASTSTLQVTPKLEHAGTSSLLLRVPAVSSTSKSTPKTPAAAKVVQPSPAPLPAPAKAVSPPQYSLKPAATPQPAASTNVSAVSGSTHYPATAYVPMPSAIATPAMSATAVPSTSTQVLRASSAQNTTPVVEAVISPAPSSQCQLRSVTVETQPLGRIVYLDHRDGVKAWALRLGSGESRVIVKDVLFMTPPDDDDDESSDDEEGDEEKQDEHEEGMEVDKVDTTPTRNGRKKGKGRRRGRPTRASTRQATIKTTKKKTAKPGEVQLKVNNLVIREQPDSPGEWDIHVPLGSSVLEVGEVEGLVWKMYIERVGVV